MISVGDLLSSEHRNDRRTAQAGLVAVAPLACEKPPVLRRCTVRWIAILGITAIIYGTLFPFQAAPHSQWSWQLTWHSPFVGDSVTNLLIYLPVGALLRLMVRRRGSLWLFEFLFAILCAVGLSYLTESLQTILARRVASWTDVCFNTAGAALGAFLAPLAQRMIRNLHSWLFVELRLRPLAAAAALLTLALCAWGLMPLDLYPAPAHVAETLREFRAAPLELWWPGELSSTRLLTKWAAGGGFALLVWFLALSRRQQGDTITASLWHGLSRTLALATTIEALQLFTISHVADPRDLATEWLSVVLSTALLGVVLSLRPGLHCSSRAVLKFTLWAVAILLFAWNAYSALHMPVASAGSLGAWQPLAATFHRPWASLLGEYTACLFRCTMLGLAVILGLRAHARKPAFLPVLLAVLGSVCLAQLAAMLLGRGVPDTVPWFIALAGTILASRLDRAFSVSPTTMQRPNPG